MKNCFPRLFCYKKKKVQKIAILEVEVSDERLKQIAKEVARKFPGVTEVVEVEGEGLEVRGEFSISELTKELKKIEEPVETNEKVPDGVTEPEVKIQQQGEGKRPINIQKASKPLNDGASSSNWTVSQNYRLLEQAKGVGAGAAAAAEQVKVIGVAAAEQVKDIGVSAAEKAKAIGKEAFNLLPNNIKGRFEKKNYRKEFRVVKPQNWKEAEMKQNKIRQEKEAENRRKKDLAEEEKRLNKIRQEKEEEERKKQASENNPEGTSTVAGITGTLWTYGVSKLTNASAQAPGTSTHRQRTGQPSTQNPFSTQKEARAVQKKGKKGR